MDLNQLGELDLPTYISLTRELPKPTYEQMVEFAHYVVGAHSWYKHLPWYPPGSPFYFFIDPAAGMDRIVDITGEVRTVLREKRGFHYSWIPTDEYRAKHGYLAFAQANGTVAGVISQNGSQTVPSDNRPVAFDARYRRVAHIPIQVADTGTTYASALMLPYSNTNILVHHLGHFVPKDVGHDKTAAKATGERDHPSEIATILYRLLDHIDWIPPWPEESGGRERLIEILRRLLETEKNPSLVREPTDDEFDAERNLHGMLFGNMVVHKLLEPERARQREGMVRACERIVNLIWGSRVH